MIKIKCNDENETNALGEKFAKLLDAGDFVCLDGDLGTGKTFLSKSIAKSLGVDEYITSPSYTIINEYEGKFPIYHFDVYRIDDVDEMYEIGYEEYFFGDGVCLVEWANMIEELLPEVYYKITISMCESFNTRIFEIEGSNDELEKKLEGLLI